MDQGNNQYGNHGYPQQQYQQHQFNHNNNNNNNWNPPPNQNQQYNNNMNNNYPQYGHAGGNWAPQNQNAPFVGNNNNEQTWHNKPQTKVTQNGNVTITETTESGGGRSNVRHMNDNKQFVGPGIFGPPASITSSSAYHPENLQKQIDYFRLKLWECSCCCGCNVGGHPCLNLWIWSMFWLIIFIFNGFINLLASFAQISSSNSSHAFSVIAVLIIIASICVNCWAMFALFKLQPVAFLIQIIFFIVLLLLVIIGLFVYPLSFGFIMMNLLFVTCDIWAIYVFWNVYGWAKHFSAGGNYDPNRFSPP